MKAQPRARIYVEISMVHPMQPPQKRHRMEQHMLQIDC